VDGLIERLRAGESIALVSDAGTPLISDPGAKLVAAAHAAGIRVEPVPGASAVTALLSAAGMGGEGFSFVGFPPSRATSRKSWLRGLSQESRPVVMYEAPHRILATLSDIYAELGNRHIGIGRELTKAHEQLAVRPIAKWLEDPPPERGEFVLVVSPAAASTDQAAVAPTDEAIGLRFGQLTESGTVGRREAIREVARLHGIGTKEVFAALERLKNLGE
jgi:16S rRNA (cytidine1402-2'-O)-methyltransferase